MHKHEERNMTCDTRRLWLRMATAIVLVACGTQSFGQVTLDARLAAFFSDAAPIASAVTTKHTIKVEGGQLDYTATAGTLQVRQDKSDAEAAVFYVSYRKNGEDAATRPITFVFNGGPGSSAAWLHMGGLGPRRLALKEDGGVPAPPARLVDNAQTWLRFTDLVFIDPVGTGYSRAIATAESSSVEVARHFWGIKSDLRSLAEFIRLYLNGNDRWASPKYLAGESYGGFRAAVLVDALPAQAGIQLDGAILVSPVIDYGLNLYFDYLSVMPWVTFVPSYAATAFQHGKYRGEDKDNGDLKQITEAAEKFSRSELLLALVSGAPRNSPEVSRVFARLAAITGLDEAEVQRQRGKITAEVFAKRLLEDRGRVIGVYDGSVSAPDPEPFRSSYSARDPSLDPLVAPLVSAFTTYVRDELGYGTDVRYELMNPDVSQAWNWVEAGLGDLPGVGQRLRRALSLNPHLKLLIAHGHFDLATPYFASKYVVERLELDEDMSPNLRLNVYSGGHMFYTHARAREQLYADVKALYESTADAPPHRGEAADDRRR
jgi:carboxypeptidase C (cathepsin A)